MLAHLLLLLADRDLSQLAPVFGKLEATFLVKEIGRSEVRVFNPKRADRAFPPCSTFKIPNTLIGLETGVVTSISQKFKWDGVVRDRQETNQDQTLESAFKRSVVWVYQDIAHQIGADRMQKFLDKLGYGNRNISGGIDKFWLVSSLEISPRQQLAFIESLYRDKLPFTQRNQALVRRLMILEDEPGWQFSGKTGSGIYPDGKRLGWFVGSALSQGRRYVFAACIEGPQGTSGMTARDQVRQCLAKLGIAKPKRGRSQLR